MHGPRESVILRVLFNFISNFPFNLVSEHTFDPIEEEKQTTFIEKRKPYEEQPPMKVIICIKPEKNQETLSKTFLHEHFCSAKASWRTERMEKEIGKGETNSHLVPERGRVGDASTADRSMPLIRGVWRLNLVGIERERESPGSYRTSKTWTLGFGDGPALNGRTWAIDLGCPLSEIIYPSLVCARVCYFRNKRSYSIYFKCHRIRFPPEDCIYGVQPRRMTYNIKLKVNKNCTKASHANCDI